MGKEQSASRPEDHEEKADFSLRVPKWMLQDGARLAGQRGLSLNAWLSNLIGKAIEDALSQPVPPAPKIK